MSKIKFIKVIDNKRIFDGEQHRFISASTDKIMTFLMSKNLNNEEELQDKNLKTKHNDLLSIFKYIKNKMKLN